MVRIKNREQVVRIDGKNCFVEVLDSAFAIEKVQLNFISYDEKTNKQIAKIPFYLDFAEFLVLKNDVLNGRMSKLGDEERKKGNKFPSAIYLQQGGVSATKLKQRGQERPDGASLSRVLKLIPGNRKPFMFQCEQGKGEENDKGLIVSRFGTKPESRVMVPLENNDIKKIVLMVSARIEAYMSAQYVYFEKDNFNTQVKENEERRKKYSKVQ